MLTVKREMHTIFFSETTKERHHLGKLGEDAKIILEWILKTVCKSVHWIHLPMDSVQDEFLWTWSWTFGFH